MNQTYGSLMLLPRRVSMESCMLNDGSLRSLVGPLASAILLAACGEAGDSGSASASVGTTAMTMAAATNTTEQSPTTGSGEEGSAGMTESSGMVPSTSGSTSGSTSEDATSSTATSDPLKLDVGGFPDAGGVGECGCGELEFSYIWIANAAQGTVSKIDTVTLEEVGRYITRPDGMGNPSRTSVSFDGDVVVANRHGGLTKIWARESDCQEKNGTPGIQTSTGAADILPWGQDECVAWYTAFPTTTNQRPVAWAQGMLNKETCAFEGAKVWTVTSTVPSNLPGVGGEGGVTVYRVAGDTGAIEDTIVIDAFPGADFGAYGAAVDQVGDLWFIPMGAAMLPPRHIAHVRHDDLTYELIPMPDALYTYGITVDTLGRVWVSSKGGAGAGRYDPGTKMWGVVADPFVSVGGLAQAPDGTIWVSASSPAGAIGFDANTLAKTDQIFLPGDPTTKGVAFDRDDRLWLVTETTAYKFDAPLQDYETYDGLTGPYTYSDMTGFGLFNTVCTPPQ